MKVNELNPPAKLDNQLAHPTLADVAAISGVSIKTASRVMMLIQHWQMSPPFQV